MGPEDVIAYLLGTNEITESFARATSDVVAGLEPSDSLSFIQRMVDAAFAAGEVAKKRLQKLNSFLTKEPTFIEALQKTHAWLAEQPKPAESPAAKHRAAINSLPRELAGYILVHANVDYASVARALEAGASDQADMFLEFLQEGRRVAARDVNAMVRCRVIDQDIADLVACPEWAAAVAKHPRLHVLETLAG